MTTKLIPTIVVFSILAGCAGSQQADKSSDTSAATELQRYEEDFRPSEYDKDAGRLFSELREEKEGKQSSLESATLEPAVVVQGYRVQLLATPEIDEANIAKAQAEAAFPGEWFYIAFDPPTYKLRAGNFLTRAEAEAYSRVLVEKGYADAWIVPDRVMKNIRPRPAEAQPE
ncbi:MAG: SPOR domain-containing protein [Bacteroidetes bacterium]|nr:SPOR domain-containing protein [Bacteroidota bacterium]MCW5894102.1 SPOR domain-containing protein [Bacteroidota bacterium]